MSIFPPQPDEPTSGYSSHFKRGEKEFQRVYQACDSCREKKARCDLGGNQQGVFASAGPPCARCRRENRQCIFREERNVGKRIKLSSDNDLAHSTSARSTQSTATRTLQNRRANNRPNIRATPSAPSPDVSYTSAYSTTSPTLIEVEQRLSDQMQNESRISRSQLSDSIVRTIVSTGNDPLRILTELSEAAAESDDTFDDESTPVEQFLQPAATGTANQFATIDPDIPAFQSPQVNVLRPSTVTGEVLSTWKRSRFVKMGLFSPEEAVAYMDAFANNMSHLVPVLDVGCLDHQNHARLLSEEPLLCTAILLISTRHHRIPGFGSASKGRHAHNQLWKYAQGMILHLMTGQDRGPDLKLRVLGSVEALLLMSEWYPQAISLPPEQSGWDCDLLEPNQNTIVTQVSNKLQDILESTKRSDRMSWMLLGAAQMLAHELDVFEGQNHAVKSTTNQQPVRRKKTRELLCIYVTLIAARLGISSMLPLTFNKAALSRLAQPTTPQINSWIDLIKLAKAFSAALFPSSAGTQELLKSGKYLELMDHFAPFFKQWKERHLIIEDDPTSDKPLCNLLFIEYHSVRIYSNSLALQAIADRLLTQKKTTKNDLTAAVSQSSYSGTEEDPDLQASYEIIDDASSILKRVVSLANANRLQFQPVRTFFRIMSASFFLIKAVMLDVPNENSPTVKDLLRLLQQTIEALKKSAVDDVHLPALHAVLLERQCARLRSTHEAKMLAKNRSKKSAGNTMAGSDLSPFQISDQVSNQDNVYQEDSPNPFSLFYINQDLFMLNDDGLGFEGNDLSFWSGFADFTTIS